MGSSPTKALDNIYCRCRKEAALHNDRLNSREGAAEMLGVSVSSLADYELGNTKVVPVDKVVLMADLYKAPEIKNFYCSCECPIGKNSVQKINQNDFDRITLHTLAAFQIAKGIEDKLISIAADGQVTGDEKAELERVLGAIDTIALCGQELRMWAVKNMKGE